jgi:16S rRNA A1518/A1519 N6-dimethyltransferase RsmA/KsgA/DIM1 with predicted DNA glycosylase/AP lyase activity
VLLEPHPRAAELGVPEEPFLRFLSACFRQKRKTLRNNLLNLYGAKAFAALPESGLRAEQCSLSELAAIYLKLNLN